VGASRDPRSIPGSFPPSLHPSCPLLGSLPPATGGRGAGMLGLLPQGAS
jgi:hypothetical protein